MVEKKLIDTERKMTDIKRRMIVIEKMIDQKRDVGKKNENTTGIETTNQEMEEEKRLGMTQGGRLILDTMIVDKTLIEEINEMIEEKTPENMTQNTMTKEEPQREKMTNMIPAI